MRYVWIVDLNTNEYRQQYCSEEKIQWFKNNPNFRVED